MKIPSLADIRRRGKSPAAPYSGRGWRFYLGAAVLLLVGIVAGYYLFFPTVSLQQRLEREIAARTPLTARVRAASLLFPPGLKAEGIHLQARTGQDAQAPAGIDITALKIAPLWRSLGGANPGLTFRADLLGGTAEGNLLKNGSVEAKARQLAFSVPLGAGVPLQLTGRLARGEFTGAWPPQPAGETRLELNFDRFDLGGLAALGATGDVLPLGTVTLTGNGRGNALKIDRLSASGGNVEVTGEGTLMLSEPLERSRLNLSLVLRPGRQLDKALADLLDLFAQAQPDGSYRLRVTGPVAQPSIQ